MTYAYKGQNLGPQAAQTHVHAGEGALRLGTGGFGAAVVSPLGTCNVGSSIRSGSTSKHHQKIHQTSELVWWIYSSSYGYVGNSWYGSLPLRPACIPRAVGTESRAGTQTNDTTWLNKSVAPSSSALGMHYPASLSKLPP